MAEGVSKPGPRNLITDVAGLKVGQAQDEGARTGTTVILLDQPGIAAVDMRGGAPGSRETDVLATENLVHTIDAITLSGGSVYGLAAADGVVAWLGANGRGFGMGPSMPGVPKSPIVPGAILFDLPNGGNKNWGMEPPYRKLGIEAAKAASDRFTLGTAGAGYGATAGALKGGIGSASFVTGDGITVGAIVAVNSLGSAVAPGGRSFWAAPFEIGTEFGGVAPSTVSAGSEDWGLAKADAKPRQNTTLAVIATDASLTQVEMKRIAMMAQDGLARAIRPVHSPFDGDIIFAVSTGKREIQEPRSFVVARLGAVAADTLSRAVARGVYEAAAWPGATIKTWKDLPKKP